MPDADVSLLADYAADIITAGVGSLAVVESVYEFTEDMGKGSGKKIFTFPVRYVNEPPESRREDGYVLRVGIIVLERYEEPGTVAKAVPTQWIKDRVAFVEQRVFILFANPRYLHTIGSYEYWAIEAEVSSVYDHDKLRQDQLFWSEILITFRTIRKPVDIFINANVILVQSTDISGTITDITFDAPVNVVGTSPPGWNIGGVVPVSIVPVNSTKVTVVWSGAVPASGTITVSSNDPVVRTYTAGYINSSAYVLSG